METGFAVIIVFVAGLITALATGLGVIPLWFVNDVSDRVTVGMWGFASGIMVVASVFGLFVRALGRNMPWQIVGGCLVGVAMVAVAERLIHQYGHHIDPGDYEEADFSTLVLILGVLTVHSFPEGVAVGVSFAQLDYANVAGIDLFGWTIPMIAIAMTVAISIHNIPEGLAIGIPLHTMDVPRRRMVWWAVFSSLPQPIGAVIAFMFVRVVTQFEVFGYAFAASAMTYLVFTELIPEALDHGHDLPRHGYTELTAGFVAGSICMAPFLLIA